MCTASFNTKNYFVHTLCVRFLYHSYNKQQLLLHTIFIYVSLYWNLIVVSLTYKLVLCMHILYIYFILPRSISVFLTVWVAKQFHEPTSY
jgi:hypothetical protein